MIAVFVVLAGGLGAVLRHLLDQWIGQTSCRWSTVGANVAGSFGFGLLLGFDLDRDVAIVAGTGFLGGFTTFSTASLIAAQAIGDRNSLVAILHTVVTAGLSVVAAAVGCALAVVNR